MLTREVTRGNLFNKLQLPSLITAVLFLGATGFAVINTDWLISAEPPLEPTTAALAGSLFAENGFVLPVEISAVLILAAILGAIVMVREE